MRRMTLQSRCTIVRTTTTRQVWQDDWDDRPTHDTVWGAAMALFIHMTKSVDKVRWSSSFMEYDFFLGSVIWKRTEHNLVTKQEPKSEKQSRSKAWNHFWAKNHLFRLGIVPLQTKQNWTHVLRFSDCFGQLSIVAKAACGQTLNQKLPRMFVSEKARIWTPLQQVQSSQNRSWHELLAISQSKREKLGMWSELNATTGR